jgi:hypothetical protein
LPVARADAAIAVAVTNVDAAPWLVDTIDAAAPAPSLDTAIVATACPSSFATTSGRCDYAGTCSFAEGSCHCAITPWCGGMKPDGSYYRQPTTWQCTPTPPKVRADGCPGTPAEGTRCKTNGKVCWYPACSCAIELTCTRHRWVRGKGACKA